MDANVQAFRLVQRATTESLTNKAKEQSSRKGGLKGGPARAKVVSPERRAEIARKASAARWARTTPAA
jgi:hypothetical protein